MFAGNSTYEAILKINSCFVNFPKESVKSVISEISNFEINQRTRPAITIKPLSSNFTKTELINGYFYKGLRNGKEQYIIGF